MRNDPPLRRRSTRLPRRVLDGLLARLADADLLLVIALIGIPYLAYLVLAG